MPLFINSNFRLKYAAFDLRFTPPWIFHRKTWYDITMAKTHTQAPQSTHQQDVFPDFPAKFIPKGIFRLITKSRGTCLKSCPACWCQSYCDTCRVSVGLSLLFLPPSFLLTLRLFLSPTPHWRNCWRSRSLVAAFSPVATTVLGEDCLPTTLWNPHVWRPSAAWEGLCGL